MSIVTVTHNGTDIIDITSALTTENKTLLTSGKYLDSDIQVNFTGSSSLVAGNIKNGVSIFGVTGNVRPFAYWTGWSQYIGGSRTFSPGFTTQAFAAFQDGQPAVSSVGCYWFTCLRNFNNCDWRSQVVGGTSVTIPVPVSTNYNLTITGYN